MQIDFDQAEQAICFKSFETVSVVAINLLWITLYILCPFYCCAVKFVWTMVNCSGCLESSVNPCKAISWPQYFM